MTDVASIYKDGTYAAKNPTFGDDDASWKAASAVRFCKQHGISAKRLAEVGCGGGAVLAGVAEGLSSSEAVGYEPMPEAFKHASRREAAGLRFVNQSIGPDTREDFDLVLCFDVFEHIEDYFGFLRNLVKMGRNFLFHIPLDMNAQMIARGEPIRRVREQVGHIHYFSRDSAIAALRECGFEVRGEEYTCGADSTYATTAYRLMALPRRMAFAIAPDLAVRTLGGYSLLVWAVSGTTA